MILGGEAGESAVVIATERACAGSRNLLLTPTLIVCSISATSSLAWAYQFFRYVISVLLFQGQYSGLLAKGTISRLVLQN